LQVLSELLAMISSYRAECPSGISPRVGTVVFEESLPN
jgi:hypothetical protein